MKSIYNIVLNNYGNHITISYKIHKSENHHKQVPKEIISSYPDLNGQAMTYYLGTVTPRSYTDRQGNTISYLIISHHICASII